MPNPIPVHDDRGAPPALARRAQAASAPVVIEVRDLEKTFVVPAHRVDTLKERVVHPLTRPEIRELRALRGVSFDVRRGEFFGVVGRNGSGKSTLLKVLASIYGADAGRVRMAGRLAPFIELGVGFNPELTARENVALNGVMMGLGRREAAARLGAVLEFAGLTEFVDLKLKNYSSGMLVRLAFAAMVQADADIMLVDEVLAVGDAAFAQRCMDVFREKRRAGRTVVLVTHDMATVQAFCDRALVLHDGRMRYLGDPEEAALRYYRLNFAPADEQDGGPRPGGVPDVNVKLVDVWLQDAAGERIGNVEQGEAINFNLILEARRDLEQPVVQVQFVNADGVWVFGFSKRVPGQDGRPGRVAGGERVRISGTMENPLVPGRYSISAWVARERVHGDLALHILRLTDFFVYGPRPGPGSVSARATVEAVVE